MGSRPRTSGTISGSRPHTARLSELQTESTVSLQTVSIDSSLRLQHAPGGKALEDVKQLPSLWSPKPLGNLASSLSGFHSFSTLSIKKPGTWRDQSGDLVSSTMESRSRSELASMPAIHASPRQLQQQARRYDRYAMYC